jgi:hypothetical protein
MTHAERDAMRSLQGDADGRIGLDAQLRHSLEDRHLERRSSPLSELISDRLVDRRRTREEMLVDRSSTRARSRAESL